MKLVLPLCLTLFVTLTSSVLVDEVREDVVEKVDAVWTRLKVTKLVIRIRIY